MSIQSKIFQALKVVTISATGGLMVGLVALSVGFLFGDNYDNMTLITSYIFIFTLLGVILLVGDYLMIAWDKIKHRKKS